MENRIAIAKFINGDKIAHTESIWQYDYGQELKLEGLDLPSAFEVHFAKELHGNAVTSLYNSGSALIPDQLIQTPGTLFAWVYLHDTESDGETEYTIVIDVKKRAKPSHETPTPAQQSEIEQLIATLETAVEESETNVTHYPKIEDGYWYVWDAVENDWSNTGVEATGPQGEQGPQGPEGPTGADGQDGYSPSASVSKSGATATITITDKNGTTTASISDGDPTTIIDDTITSASKVWSSSKVDSTKMDKNNPTGTGSLSLNRREDTTVGTHSVAEGTNAAAIGTNSHAEGMNTTANGAAAHAEGCYSLTNADYTHAEGYYTQAKGAVSHAEGNQAKAEGINSHAEGSQTQATGRESHAQGDWTIAAGKTQFAFGRYNIEDTSDTYAEICGNGTGYYARSNARTLDWNGNEVLAGKLTIGSNPTAEMDVVPKAFMEQAIQDAVLSILPKKTVSGAVASFSDAQPDLPLVDLTAQIVPFQDGTGDPSPQNVRTIHGYTGAHIGYVDFNQKLFSLGSDSWESSDATFADGVCTWTPTVQYSQVLQKNTNEKKLYLTNGHTYFFSVEIQNANVQQLNIYTGGAYWLAQSVQSSTYKKYTSILTASVNTGYWRLIIQTNASSGWGTLNIKNIQFFDLTQMFGVIAGDVTADNFVSLFHKDYYEKTDGGTLVTVNSVNGDTLCPNASVQFGQTVYGGTWKAKEGKVDITHGLEIDMGALSWTKRNTSSGHWRFTTQDVPVVIASDSSIVPEIYCEMYLKKSPSNTYGGITGISNNTTISQICVCDENYSDAAAFTNAVNGCKLVYPLATPTEISVDAVNLTAKDGVNNIVADTGNSSVTYAAKIT